MDNIYSMPFLLSDWYKIGHVWQYPKNTTQIYSTWIPRASRIPGIDHVVAFGLQAFIKKYLIEYFNSNFFARDINEICNEYTRIVSKGLGIESPDCSHLRSLHAIGYLPILIKAVPEGTRVPLRVPMFTLENTLPEAFWVTNAIETLLSAEVWHPSTSSTLAYEFRKMLDIWADNTGGPADFVPFQGHDFSMRGMSCVEAAAASGAGHLLSFVGSDTIPAITYLEKYYNANIENELISLSVPATEHSVQSAYGKENEREAYRRLLTEVYPKGIVSIVSDTYDLWSVLTDILPSLKTEIMNRDGTLTIRPDSGVPADIVCGDPKAELDTTAALGVVEALWNEFGGTINSRGYKELDSHVKVIYGDAITQSVGYEICERLAAKNFASTNVLLGVGSFTYQYVTRDTFSFALKSTYAVIDGEEVKIFKDPITDPGSVKKSLVGRVVVRDESHGGIVVQDNLTKAQQDELSNHDILQTVFEDGYLTNEQSFADIRKKLHPNW